MFDRENWKSDGIAGWSMGFYNRYHIQLIRGANKSQAQDNVYSMGVTFVEELIHGMDEFLWYELGISLEKILGVEDFDRDIVHAKRWNYDDELRIIIPYLIKIFSNEEDMKLTKEQVQKLYVLSGQGLGDLNALKYWSGKELDDYLNSRVKDLQKEVDMVL